MFLATSSGDPAKSFSMTNAKTPKRSAARKSFMSDLGTPGPGQSGFGNPVFDMQDKYLRELEEDYEFMQNTKKAKKFQIIRSIRKL